MPMNSWTDAKRKLDQMVATARREPDRIYQRNYGGNVLVIHAEFPDEPIFTFGGRMLDDQMDAIKLVQTWDQPTRAVFVRSNS